MRGNLKVMRPRWRKVFSDLWANKLRTLLVVASISVGVFSVGTIATAYVIISEDMNVSYSSANPANIEISTDLFDESYVRSVENVDGVGEAEGRRIFKVRASLDREDWLGMDMVAIEDYTAANINQRYPVEAGSVPADREIVIEKELLKDMQVQVGDTLYIQLPDGTIRSMPVVGIVQDHTTSAGDFMGSPLGFISFDTLAWLQQPSYFNRLYATVEKGSNDETHMRYVAEEISDKLDRSHRETYQTTIKVSDEHPLTSTIMAALGILGALGVLMVLLSSSLIANTLSALLNQHLRQIGVMKLIGARSFQILGMYIVLILAFGGIALLISVPLSGQAGYALAEFAAYHFNFNLQGFHLVPLAVLLQVVIATLVPLAAGFLPVNSGSRTKVRRAISGDRPGATQTKTSWIERFGARFRWVSRPLVLSVRNTFRRKGRLVLTLFTLTMAGAIFIAVFNVRASLEQFIDQLGDYFLADVTLNFDYPYRLSKVEQAVMDVPGVTAVEGWAFASGEVIDPYGIALENVQILAPPADSTLIDPDMIQGRWIMPGDTLGITVSEKIWSIYPHLKPGDTIRMKVQDKEEDWTVVGIFRFTSQEETILAYANYEHISKLVHMHQQSFSFRVVTEEHTWEYQSRIGRELDRQLRARGFHISEAEAGLTTMRMVSEYVNILVAFLLIMALLTALVGSIGLTGTMGMNVLERTREIGVMRAIGAVDLEIIKSVILEGTLIGMISWFLGALLSFPISYLLLRIISVSLFETPIPLAYSLLGFAIWLGVVLALSASASILPARSASRLTIREVLAYE